jgi:hypothetical protein
MATAPYANSSMPSLAVRLCPGFEAKPAKPSPAGFEAQSTKPPWVAYSIRVPTTRRVSPPSSTVRLPSLQSHHSTCTSMVLTRSTRSLLHVHLRLSMSPNARHRSWSPGLLVPRSKPHVRPSPLPVHRHVPTWPSPRRRPPPPSFTPAHHKPRDMLHNPTHVMVNSQTQPKMQITLTITYHKSEPQGYISTLCSHTLNHIITWPILVL